MNNIYMHKKKLTAATSVLLLAMLAIVFSCNKTFKDTLPPNDGTGGQVDLVSRKVLLIVVDGALGSEVKTIAPPTLSSLVDFSIFSWDGLSDFKNTPISNELSWTTLFTGVNSDKHNVTGTDFAGNNLANYPTLFSRIQQQRPQMRTAAYCSSPEVAANLTTDATQKKSFAEDDAAVKEAIKTELSTKDPGLVLAQFHSVDKAGMADSYTAGSASYSDAVLQVDAYIGEMLTAMRARSNFKNENWMVIITSNKGNNTPNTATGASWSAFQDQRHNTFFFCYNPRFKSANPTKPGAIIPYVGSSPRYDGTNANSRSQVLDGGTAYDFGTTGSYTIQCKVKFPSSSDGYYYPSFLSKRASFDGGVGGWLFFLEGDSWQINFSSPGHGNIQVFGSAITDNEWHTLTAVIKQEGSARNVYTYTDGVYSGNSGNISSLGNINSNDPLTIGFTPGSRDDAYSPVGYFVTDVRIYNTALTDAYITSNYCSTFIDPSDPYLSNLLGFWPCTSVPADKKMADLSANNHPMVGDKISPSNISDVSTNVCPLITDDVYKTVPNSVDIAPQIYQWLGITVPANWNLDGKNWVPAFSDLGG